VKAYQRILRERLAAASNGAVEPADIRTAEVRPVSFKQATQFIKQFEFLGTMPAVSRFYFGIFFQGRLGGVVVYGDEPGENLLVWNRYGYTGKIITLQRGACAPWAHPHAASKLIRRSMDLLPERFQVITATVDLMAGEIGVIYQSAGFDYVGVMHPGTRLMAQVDGKLLSERTIVHRYGTSSMKALAERGIVAVKVPRRARYFGFRGDGRDQDRLREAIATLLKPYPKRDRPVASRNTGLRCQGPGCWAALPRSKRADSQFCSDACRSRSRRWALRQLTEKQHCARCQKPLPWWYGLGQRRDDARYCAPKCRQAAYRLRRLIEGGAA
jgi:hypothetical protein